MDDRELGKRAHGLLMEALDRPTAERQAFVRQTCSKNPVLLARVLAMLESADAAENFLDEPVLKPDALNNAPLPDAIGNYLVVGVLGKGGMATVFEAVQEHPKRRVALKVLNQAMISANDYARFSFETEALARLHHPAIAQIYEAGAARIGTTTPCPFFAMELVADALPITEYVSRHHLSLPARLEMLATVCDAVHHGHQHGVIHRDIKPGNVLVDGEGRPKVIDFGIARTTESQPDAKTAITERHQLVGTLHAMSPEQCDTNCDVDIRTDVYSLGVMLYQLITDKKPLDFSTCSIPEAIRLIAEVEPTRPGSLVAEARGDLDAIVAKAMNKDRELRYASAAALSADLRRYLNHQPIDARSPSRWELVRKFIRRNRPLAYTGLTAVALLLIVTIVSVRLAWVEYHARQASEERQKELEMVTEFQETLLRDIDVEQMGQRLQQSYHEELQRVVAGQTAPLEDALQKILKLNGQMNYTSLAVKALKESVLQHYWDSIRKRFAEEPVLLAQLLQRLARTMHEMGLHADSEPVLRETLEIRRRVLGSEHEETLLTLHSLGSLLTTLRRHDEALVILQETYAARAKVHGVEHPNTLRTAASLAGCHRYLGNLDDAEGIWSDTLDAQRRILGDDHTDTQRTLNNMGVVYATQGRLEEAEICWRELLEIRQRNLADPHLEYSYRSVLSNLCMLLQDQGKDDETGTLLPLVEKSLEADRREFGDLHTNTLMTMGQLASLLTHRHEYERAERLQREFVAGRRQVLGPDNSDTLLAQFSLAENLLLQNKLTEASDLATHTLESQRRLLGDRHAETIESISLLSRCLRASGEQTRALPLSAEAVNAARETLPANHWMLGWLLFNHGELLIETGQNETGIATLNEGARILEKALGGKHPKVVLARQRVTEAATGVKIGIDPGTPDH